MLRLRWDGTRYRLRWPSVDHGTRGVRCCSDATSLGSVHTLRKGSVHVCALIVNNLSSTVEARGIMEGAREV